jgi:hypothetical protein
MEQIIGAVIGGLALVGIPFFSWVSRRASSEGRKLLRVERLGTIYALMPESDEKKTFGGHVTLAAKDLNEWINLDNAKLRYAVRIASATILVVGFTAAFVVGSIPSIRANDSATLTTGIAFGALISFTNLGSSYLFEKRAIARAKEKELVSAKAEEAARHEAFRLGTTVTVGPTRGSR